MGIWVLVVITNKVAVNISIQVFSVQEIARCETAGGSIFNILRNNQTAS